MLRSLILLLFLSAQVSAQFSAQVSAQAPAKTPAPPTLAATLALAAPPTLAATLALAAPPEEGVALAVGADKVALPKGAVPPEARSAVPDVAGAYGRIIQNFGVVAAVAPPTMAVVGVPPDRINPYDGMPPADVLKLLAGSLSRDQWKLLLGASGLGLPDLTTDTQRDLFAALFPGGVFKVQWDRPNEMNRPEDIRDVSADLPSARLRLGQAVMLGLPETGHPDIHSFGMSFEPAGSPKRYIQVVPEGNKDDFVDGARVRAVVPNVPKEGQLDLAAPALKVSVPLAGLKTLGDLFSRISRLTNLELYADARFEGRRLLVLGKPLLGPSAPAADLLRAAAFCLTGTYRKVGPAFVLTDDVVGIGARRQKWADFEREAAAGRQKALDAAGDAVYAAHSARDIPPQGNLLALSAAQIAEVQRQHAKDLAHGMTDAGGMLRLSLPFAKLTPAQQEVARHSVDYYAREPEDERPTLEGDIALQSETSLQVLLPAVDGPVMMNYNFDTLFSPSNAMTSRMVTQASAASRPPQPAWQEQLKAASALPLAPLLNYGTRRAVLTQPKSAADVDAQVVSMKALGLNQLWLPVFAGGVAQMDTLDEALKVTHGTGIQVFAVLNLLTWGRDAAKKAGLHTGLEAAGEGLEDLTLRGETSAEAAAREARLRRLEAGVEAGLMPAAPADTSLAVSPFAAPVRETLRAVLADLSTRRGLAGVVWRDTAAAGYLPLPPGWAYGGGAEPLGYAEPTRLSFLRADHADPIDLFPGEHLEGRADTRLPGFDDPALESVLCARWGNFREQGDLALLRLLAVQAPGRILLASRAPEYRPGNGGPDWYGTWDDPAHPPAHRGELPQDERAQARAQSRVSLHPVQAWLLGAVPEESRAQMMTAFKLGLRDELPSAPAKAWDGYVLDTIPPPLFSGHIGATPDPLAPLVADLHKP